MAFDAGMMAAVAAEVQQTIIGSKIEKIYQPGKDEITLCLRGVTRRLMVNVSGDRPRVCLTKLVRENPQVAPMFCMLLRKHLSGAVLREVHQEGFERVLRFKFETRDEMGYPCTRYLICEIMGKWSNLMFCNEADKILAVLRPVDFYNQPKATGSSGNDIHTSSRARSQNKSAPRNTKFLSATFACRARYADGSLLTLRIQWFFSADRAGNIVSGLPGCFPTSKRM